MIVTIHQPEHLIWLGLIKKISDADTFVILDSVQFRKNYFQNRNKIKTRHGSMWLTVPVKSAPLDTKIKDIEISYDQNWQEKYLNSIRTHYGASKYFKEYYPKIEQIVLKNHKYLADLNIDLINFFLDEFGVKGKKIIKSSEIDLDGILGGSNVCLEICKKNGECTYLAGPSGKDYLNLDDFDKEKIKVIFHEFEHPSYGQLHGEFLPGMSSLDALFNLGPEAKKILV